jgi:light-regulated signal transduction histidine kinase (bacteriophytochrome)
VEEIFVTHSLGAEMLDADALAKAASGVMAASVSRLHPSFVFWFRPEVVATVSWGGDPHKRAEPAEAGPEPRRLSPRHSFEAWKETVRGTSAPWGRAEIETACELRQHVIEAALRRSEARLRELQTELLHVSRLSAAGEMAAALAHELHQPLTAVVSAVETAGRILASSPAARVPADMQDALDLAAEQSLRAGEIVRCLRGFITKGEAEMRSEDPRRIVEEAVALALLGVKGSDVAVSFRFPSALPHVIADRIQIQQVLVNLIRNAVEAMAGAEDDDGRQHRKLVVAAIPAGPSSIEVSVADTGPGLAPELAEHLFDAFASTKSGGLGIGLSISRSIVEAHGGRIWAGPNPGGGTVFRFTLPTVRGMAY